MPYDKGGSYSIIDYKVRYVQEMSQFAAGTPGRQEIGMELKTEKPAQKCGESQVTN